ncbi:MAG: glycosyltransferase family 2 protein, partial [Pontixanthobacter sp.]
MFWTVVAYALALPLTVILAYLAFELLFGIAPLRSKQAPGNAKPAPHTAILIPAHNEAGGIAETIADLRASAPDAFVLVVADNCTDETARIAREAGADVTERHDTQLRGKGFALAHGREVLSRSSDRRPSDTQPFDRQVFEAVIVIDADCRLAPGSAERLARRVVDTGGPVQAANLLISQPDQPPLVAISNFAMLIKNLVRARGLMRLGGGASLFGTGMAFPWPMFARLQLATDNAV